MESQRPAVERACRCGYTRAHHMVSADPQYTVLGWLKLVAGITSRPKKIQWRCRRCDQVIASTTDAAALDTYY